MSNFRKETETISQESLKTFAKRARELRQERGLTLEALGNFLGYSRSAISSYECSARMPDLKVLKAYSDFFDVPVDYLIGKINIRKPLQAIACLRMFRMIFLISLNLGFNKKSLKKKINKF